MRIFPAIDLKEGKAVRLLQGRMEDVTVYGDNPLEIALGFKEQGAEYLHVVDLDGAFAGKPVNDEIIHQLIKSSGLKVQVGGGIRTLERIEELLSYGVERVVLGTVAVRNPQLVAEAVQRYGEAIVVGIDAKDGWVAVQGWAEKTEIRALELALKMKEMGVKHLVFTDIARDGMLQGANIESTAQLARESGLNVVASGGIATLEDIIQLQKVADEGVPIYGAIIGKALYTGAFTLAQALEIAKGDPNKAQAEKETNGENQTNGDNNTKEVKRIIPCLDVHEGRVVKGVNFVNIKDAGDPVELAALYDREGADELVLLDISASAEGRGTMVDVVKKVAPQISIPLIIGGGLRTIEDIQKVLEAGADKVSLNTSAVQNPQLIQESAKTFGSERIIAAIDARQKEPGSWEVYISGGKKATGKDVIAWAKEVEALGAGEILLTSMDRDGTKSGYDLELTRAVSRSVSIPVIASGGVGNLEHLADGLKIGEASAVLAASIFHYGEYSIAEAKDYLEKQGIAVNRR